MPGERNLAAQPPAAGVDMIAPQVSVQTPTAATPCPDCGRPLYLTAELLGRTVRCRACRAVLAVVAGADSIVVTPCPACQHPLHLTSQLAGCRVRCRSCRAELAVAALGGLAGPRSVASVHPTSAATEPCPHCGNPLKLVPALNGRLIRCRACQSVLGVEARDWRLSVEERPGAPAERETAAPAAAPAESIRPPESPCLPGDQEDWEAHRHPENLSVPDVLSDEEASDILEELDTADEAQRRRRGPSEFRLPQGAQTESRIPFDPAGTESGRPAGNGKPADPKHGTSAPPNRRQPGRLTHDASDAAARLLSPKSFAARLKQNRSQSGSPSAQPARPDESPPAESDLPTTEAEPLQDERKSDPRPKPAVEPIPEPKAEPATNFPTAHAPKPAPRRHAQSSLAGRRGGRRAISAAVIVTTLAAAVAGSCWWLFREGGHPRSQYLPRHIDLFLSMDWPASVRPASSRLRRTRRACC